MFQGLPREIHKEHDLKQLTKRPPKPKWPKVVGWLIPLIIIAMVVYTFLSNPVAGMQQATSWILWHGALSALGVAIALGHPVAIITAFVAAPISALDPLTAAGWFAGFVQAYFSKPTVRDFERLSEDVFSFKGFWKNKVTRVLLVVVFANIGSSLGTFIGGADVVRLFIDNLIN
jgi:pheromone shutdown protein TraB